MLEPWIECCGCEYQEQVSSHSSSNSPHYFEGHPTQFVKMHSTFNIRTFISIYSIGLDSLSLLDTVDVSCFPDNCHLCIRIRYLPTYQ